MIGVAITGWAGLEGTPGIPQSMARSPRAAATVTCPGGFGMSPETPGPARAVFSALPPPHAEVEL